MALLGYQVKVFRSRLVPAEPVSQPSKEKFGLAELGVVRADLHPKIIELNKKAGMPKPELMGGSVRVHHSCVYRPGNIPPMTMITGDAIVEGQQLFMGISHPTAERPMQGFEYNAHVLYAEAFPA